MKITTYRPKKKSRKRKHGFLSRMNKDNGKNVLSRRRRKGRHSLTV